MVKPPAQTHTVSKEADLKLKLRAASIFYQHHAAFYKNGLEIRVVTHWRVGVDYSDFPLIFLAATILTNLPLSCFVFFCLTYTEMQFVCVLAQILV